jgi:ABC-type multidrug transport system ATPase subunit
MTNATPLLNIVQGKKRYGSRTVLNIDQFSLNRHDRIVLLGENGSGKSTLLRVLAGVAPLSRGHITRSRDMANMRIGFVPQAGGLYDDLTIRQNLDVYCRLYGVAEIRSPADEPFIRSTSLVSYMDTPVSHLSGGIQKLSVLACVFAICPHGLLLDEPSSDLDDHHSRHLYDMLERLSEKLAFVVVSTHESRNTAFLTRRVTMKKGEIT